MPFIVRRPWDLRESEHTCRAIYERRGEHRREFLRMMGLAATGVALGSTLSGCSEPTEAEISAAGKVEPLSTEFMGLYPARRNDAFNYGRPETVRREAAQYANFYEFAGSKDIYRHVDRFQPSPWSFEVDGLCAKPRKFDMDDVYRTFALEERAYRHRCVETWAMCVPWTGFPLKALLAQVEPTAAARYVRFETFLRPEEASQQSYSSYPWPYTEGLTIEEANNELALIATGIFGEPLPKQHGAPLRLVAPWKYGFKGIKSIVRITLTDEQPATFWNTLSPYEYEFEANVDPAVPHPRWSQATEWMLGTYERFETQKYNGYGEYVADLYQA
jgi:sulfoxide reductase catalytic subunit YedY